MRSVWNCVLKFGQVAVPLALVPARRDSRIEFRTIHRPCGNPVETRTVCPVCGDAPAEELVKGWEVAPGQFVLVEDADLDALTGDPGRELETVAYVDQTAIAPAYLVRTYYLRPTSDTAGRRAYLLVADALTDTQTAMIVRYVSRKVEHLAAVRTLDHQLLGLQTLALADEILDPGPILDQLAPVTITDGERTLGRQLAARYRSAFDPTVLASRQRERVRELLEGKLAADEITVPATAPVEGTELAKPPVDLEAALRASLKQAPKPRRRRKPAAAAA